MTALDISVLEASVEALIQQQVASYEEQLREALAGVLSKTRRERPRGRATKSDAASKRSAPGPRRVPEELEALAERFFAAVEATPGETMLTLAGSLGLRSKELERPVLRLKKAGRIKTVGERNWTRYFAMTPRAA